MLGFNQSFHREIWNGIRMDDKETFGDFIRRKRIEKGWGLRTLAANAGITHPTVSLVENNKTGATREMVRKLAGALEIDISDAIHVWLGDEGQEGGAIVYIADPEEAEMVKYLRGMPPELRPSAVNAVKSFKTAGDVMRERSAARTIGKRADRDENPSIRKIDENGESDDAITFND